MGKFTDDNSVDFDGSKAFMVSGLIPKNAGELIYWEPNIDIYSLEAAINDFGILALRLFAESECDYLMNRNTRLPVFPLLPFSNL